MSKQKVFVVPCKKIVVEKQLVTAYNVLQRDIFVCGRGVFYLQLKLTHIFSVMSI